MTTALTETLPLIPKKDNLPITVDWSTTIQSLSTDLQGYDVSFELTTNNNSLKKFFNNGRVFKAEKPLSNIEHFLFVVPRPWRFAKGATLLVDILVGQTTIDKAVDLVRGLRATHKDKIDYMKNGKRKTYHDRIILDRGFSILQTRHSFNVGEIHQLASML